MTHQDMMAIPATGKTTVMRQAIGSQGQGISGTITGRRLARKHVIFAPVSTPHILSQILHS